MNRRNLFFAIILLITQKSYSNDANIIGGKKIDSSDFPQMVALFNDQSEIPVCSATIVGAKAFLTSSRCKTATYFLFENKKISFNLKISPSFVEDEADTHDLAIGILNSPLDIKQFASVESSINIKEMVSMIGFGPTTFDSKENFINVGDSRILGVAKRSFYLEGLTTGTAGFYGSDIGGAVLKIDNKKHLLVGVLSDVVYLDKVKLHFGGIATRLDSDWSQNFLKETIKGHQIEICGINKDCQ